MFLKLNRQTWILTITLLLATQGCDGRVTQMAREAADRQAQQNIAMAELQKEVASGSHQLVEADAQARQEIFGVHHDLQAERTRLDTSRSELESERREIASQRRMESLLVAVVSAMGGFSLVVMLLGFCWYALVVARRGDGFETELNELLFQELLADQLLTLPGEQQPAELPDLSAHPQPRKA